MPTGEDAIAQIALSLPEYISDALVLSGFFKGEDDVHMSAHVSSVQVIAIAYWLFNQIRPEGHDQAIELITKQIRELLRRSTTFPGEA